MWQGDITTLSVDAVVNAANSGMTGCYYPCHACIDNAIHTYAGVLLRNACAENMKEQGHGELMGQAKITGAYNLPSKYVLHTVGPIVQGRLTQEHRTDLQKCYRSCLELATKKQLQSVAFCCISTGEFHFPNQEATQIAVATVKEFLSRNGSGMKVIFNVFKDADYQIYDDLLYTLKGEGERDEHRLIAEGITFIMNGANHHMDGRTTYPSNPYAIKKG